MTLTATQQANITWLSLLIVPGVDFRRRASTPGGGGGKMRGLQIDARAARRPGRPRRLHLLRHLEAARQAARHRHEAGEGVRRPRVRQDRRAQGQVAIGRRRRRSRKTTARWKIVAPVADAGGRGRRVRRSPTRSAQLEIVRVIDENPTDLKDYGLGNAAHRDRLQGGGDKDYQQAAASARRRRPAATCTRSATTRSGSS